MLVGKLFEQSPEPLVALRQRARVGSQRRLHSKGKLVSGLRWEKVEASALEVSFVGSGFGNLARAATLGRLNPVMTPLACCGVV
jgi:hypothetical protein